MTDAAPLTLWHASRADVDRPTIAGRTEGTNHGNSGLGIFCATGPHDYIGGFGDAIHSLTLRADARTRTITVRELYEMGEAPNGDERDRAWFNAEGRRLAEKHDVVLIAESSGWVSQAVILRDDAVASSRRMTREEFAAVSYDMDRDNQAVADPGGSERHRAPEDAPALVRQALELTVHTLGHLLPARRGVDRQRPRRRRPEEVGGGPGSSGEPMR